MVVMVMKIRTTQIKAFGDPAETVQECIEEATFKLSWFLEFTGSAYDCPTKRTIERNRAHWKKWHPNKPFNEKNAYVRQIGIGKLTLYGSGRQAAEDCIDEFDALSGPSDNGLLPNNEKGYWYTKPELRTGENKIGYEDEEEFSFHMRMTPDAVGARRLLLIHPTRGKEMQVERTGDDTDESSREITVRAGETQGCIGLCGGHEQVQRFYDLMMAYFSSGNTKIRTIVRIDGNANIKVQLGNKRTYKNS